MNEVTLNNRLIDVSKVLPLKLRDWKALENQGITPNKLMDGRLTEISAVLFYILNKADSSVTADEVDDLQLDDPAVVQVLNLIASTGSKSVADRPT